MTSSENISTQLTIDQVVENLDTLHAQGTLTLATVAELLKSLIYTKEMRKKIFSTPKEASPPTHRYIFWKSSDHSSLEGFGWAPKTSTHIHNHDHEGLARHLEGNLEVINFHLSSPDTLICTEKYQLAGNKIVSIPKGNACIHTVCNVQEEEAVDIHFYSPKITEVTPTRFDPVDSKLSVNQVKKGQNIPVSSQVDLSQV